MQVVVERPGELIPRCFWLLTSMPSGEMSGEDLLALYRKRGKAEGHLGELMSVVAPALSSTSRRKSHYRGKEIRKREKGVDAFACNQVRLLLAGFGYQIMHVQRAVLERVTGTGWSLRRLAERVLRTPARFTVSGRRIAMIASAASRQSASPGPPAPAPARTRGVEFQDQRGTEGSEGVASLCPRSGSAGPIGGSKPETLAERRLGAPSSG